MLSSSNKEERITSGLIELDEILCGGFIPNRAYLLQGAPGTGKTTLGLYFLAISKQLKEKALFITFEEKETTLRKNAQTIGIDLSGVEFLDLTPESEYFVKVQSYDIFSPAEVEREPIIKKIIETIKKK